MSATFLDGGGELGALMRATDWARTPLGPIDTWPQSLRTTISTCLNSRFPILIWWGPQFVKIYNDAYREVIAGKHPHALGRPGREVWPEIWHIIGPMLESVVSEGRATWSEDQFLPLERHGYSEECYFTFSYSPIRDESGGVGGVFSAVTETTGRVIGERRLRLLQALAAETASDTTAAACERATAILAGDTADLPFALVYLLDTNGVTLRLAASTGVTAPGAAAPATIDLTRDDTEYPWPFRRVVDSLEIVHAESRERPGVRAFVAPITASQTSAIGVLVAGVSPMLPVTDQYRGFAALVAREIGGSVAQARAFEDERRRAEALAELDRAKTAFFSNVSHEFRTPLTLMLGPIEEALALARPSLQGEQLATAHRNALRLLKLVNTLLDFSRIEAGRARATLEPTDLCQLTIDLASTFRSAMTRAGLRFEIACGPVAAPVHVDRDAWEKIVLNLLSNALKFTFDGSITVALRQRGDRVELLVSDTGVGIPAHDLSRVFDRFHRVQGIRARTHEGSGIGLALVNELVVLHGGSLAVSSEVGVGTTFRVSIPARLPHESAETIRRLRTASADDVAKPYLAEALRWLPSSAEADAAAFDADALYAPPMRILLADDNADMREYVARLLSDRWTVEAVSDGAAALEAARARPPALVISDVMMPRLDGFGLVQALRGDPATREIPVILLSARAGEEASIEGLESGADDYIVKPFSARELRARVDAQLLRASVRAIQAAHDRRLADIFRHAPVAAALLRGPDHVFEFANDEYLEVIGRRDVLGKPALDALPELRDQGIRELLDDVYASGQPYSASSLCVTLNRGPQGAPEEIYFNFVYQPVRNLRGEVEGIAIVAVDVTELAGARHAAEAANRAKDDFLAVLGHELRNPLASILTAAKLLELKGPPDPALQKPRDTISRQAKHLAKLVDDLLDVGRIITGKLRLEKTRVDLAALVKQAIETSSPLIERRRHTLRVALPDAPVLCEADGPRISQVITNLLNNAAKFMSEEGQIDLTVAKDAGSIAIRVRDQGIGIAPDMLERVFERFVQAGDSGPRHGDGLGIGLSLVKTIVDLHGGTVIARSDGPGLGSEFTVSLPVAASVHAAST